ncbi:hypothetical protein FOC84_21240 [Achromobacter pestifer]|uniref:Uncharacterized protein n=1 Tax=Achromobacter pestifer TaxID=1353889 RepID=A0A7D4IA83_9BURK|nr:hypothetical protein [Achromobacter pestifer]QKH37321.1 hypothetical protein FOC84_21240 [Achromobacter pestifer]
MHGYGKRNFVISVVIAIALYFTIAGADVPLPSGLQGTSLEGPLYALHIGNPILFNLGSGLFITLVFWFLVVELPERKTRAMVRDGIQIAYKQCRSDLATVLLDAAKPHNFSATRAAVVTDEGFVEYFQHVVDPAHSKSRWDNATAALAENDFYIRRIHAALEVLANEISYAMVRAIPRSRKCHDELRDFVANLFEIRATHIPGRPLGIVDVNLLASAIWGLMAGVRASAGQKPFDIERVAASF